MIHIFFSVHLTIYRSAKSQPSSLRLERLQHFRPLRSSKSGLCWSDSPPHIQRPVDLTARFGLTFRANLSHIFFQTKTKQTYLSEMDTVENIFLKLLDTNLCFNRIYFHTWSVIQVKFKLVGTLGWLFSLLRSNMPHWWRAHSPQSSSKSNGFSLSKSDLIT